MRQFGGLVLAAVLAGCAAPAPPGLDEAPSAVSLSRGDHRAIADCAYARLTAAYPNLIITQANLESRQSVSLSGSMTLSSGALKLFTIDFARDRPGVTRVEFRSYPTLAGGAAEAAAWRSKFHGCLQPVS